MKNIRILPKNPSILLSLLLVCIAFLFATIACGTQTPPAQQAPVASSGENQQTYPVQQIYDDALEHSATIIQNEMETKALMNGLSWAFLVLAIGVVVGGFRTTGCVTTIGIAFVAFLIGNGTARTNIPETVYTLSHEYANVALNDGVDRAQKLQASNEQYIAATISGYGVDAMTCTETINSRQDCSAVTNYYSTSDVNCTTYTDSDGDEHESCDTKYTPWFPHVRRDYIVVATKAKYLDSRVYEFKCVNPDTLTLEACSRDADGNITDSRNPAIMLHTDWRAPKDGQTRPGIYWVGNYENGTPQLWTDVQSAQSLVNAGQPAQTITGYFAGKYFHWNLAAGSPGVTVYDGPYERLQQLVELPEPDKSWFNYTDALGRTVSMETLLYSADNNLATILDPVFFIGFDENDPEVVAQLNSKGREFQGTFGPNKQSINYLVIINEDIVTEMGGIFETTTALMGWLQDENRWGLFRIPKNQTLTIASAPADLNTYTQLNFETGLPWGNELVKQDIRLSIDSPQPLNWDSLMGIVDSTYVAGQQVSTSQYGWMANLGYQFSDMTQAGGIIGALYENELPQYVNLYPTPDPNSEECETAQPEHPGYVRYQMCTQQFLQTTIQINEDGRTLILMDVEKSSRNAVGGSVGVFLWGVVFLMAVVFRAKMEE